jgi:hypothetical protein
MVVGSAEGCLQVTGFCTVHATGFRTVHFAMVLSVEQQQQRDSHVLAERTCPGQAMRYTMWRHHHNKDLVSYIYRLHLVLLDNL